MKERILVIGNSGMVGHIVYLYLKDKGYTVDGISNIRKIDKDTIVIDVRDLTQLENFLSSQKYKVIINCSAILIKESETNKLDAIRINTLLPLFLEKRFLHTKTKLIHISTDGVFSGNEGNYLKTDFTDSYTFYGRSKALGEIVNNKDLTIRSGLWGPDHWKRGVGVLNWFLKQEGQVYGFDNVFFNGVTSLEAAKFIESAIIGDYVGIYHLCANEMISKEALLCKIQKHFKKNNIIITAKGDYNSNHTLINKDDGVQYEQKNYDEMITELLTWIKKNNRIYPTYYGGGRK
jgi:dTDP-4-dehydrorhamnose reductase